MSRDFIVVEDFSSGFNHKRDVTQLAPGALILGSQNVVITDGDRVSVRKGSKLLGAVSTASTPITSAHTMKRRDGTNVPIRAYSTLLEYYHAGTGAWENLNDGYTTGLGFGFADHNINDDGIEYTYLCNGIEPYSRWTGQYDLLNGALVGAETEIVVDNVLTDDIFYGDTASSVSTTTVVVPAGTWASGLWDDFYVRITSGAQIGKISKISATTATQITFAVIAGLSGTPTFEIRRAKFADSGTLRLGTTDVTYTSLDQDNRFAGCSNVPAASDNAAITQAITEYKGNPRGNILLVLNTRMFVAGITDKRSTIKYSKIADATDFTFSSPRVADDGGVIDTPEGGGAVIGVGIQEETIYAIKEDILKTITFTNDVNDFPVIKPLIESPQVGASFRLGVFKIDNQLFFTSKEGGVKAAGRVANIDFVQPLQLSDPIVSLAKDLIYTSAAGIFYRQKAYIACRTKNSTTNNVVLVYNAQKKVWEAPIVGWNVATWFIYNGLLHSGSSTSPETYQVEVEDQYDDNDAPYECIARFAYNNFGSPTKPKSFTTLFLEGYISENTTISVKARYNYLGTLQTKSTELAGTESTYIVASVSANLLSNWALAMQPLAAVVPSDDVPNELQKFRIYFETTAEDFYELSTEVSSNEVGAQWELLRYATDTVEREGIIKKLIKKFA